MSDPRIAELEQQIFSLTEQLHELRRNDEPTPVSDYSFTTLDGTVKLSELFGERKRLLMIHNMGEACRYCTLWADGFNSFLPHLESALAVVLVSKDTPAAQRLFANSRGWRFRLASHGGLEYASEQTVIGGAQNMPGAVVYERDGEQIFRRSECAFGPGDLYCSLWHLLGLAGLSEEDWTPQYQYWLRPAQLEDGGENLLG